MFTCKTAIGTFDTAIVASAKLAGATRFSSFDNTAKALASAEGIEVFPPPPPQPGKDDFCVFLDLFRFGAMETEQIGRGGTSPTER